MSGARRFRKRPVEVDAIPVREALSQNRAALPRWVVDAFEHGNIAVARYGGKFQDSLSINTNHGWVRGDSADWIICSAAGEVYPCTAEVFMATYEPVE